MPLSALRSLLVDALRLARREIGLSIVILGLGAALLGFSMIAGEVREGELRSFDRAVLLALRNPLDASDPIGPRWLELAVADITSLGGYAVLTLITITTAGYFLTTGKRHAATLVIVAVVGGTLLSEGLKAVFARARPDLVAHLAEVHSASFPSGHAMLSAVTYLTLGALIARVQPQRRVKTYVLTVAALTTLLVGVSRVYLGVHWPTDVLAGWCVGAAWSILCWLVALALQRGGQVEEDAAG